ncbi:MAG: RsmB/NOP family class I SAM-dependent RNA methyltransferase [Archangium sp.]|nr:RsmB/NOP family class I SAM-dependent RNA methyltransferase [Archangium sp.]
MSDAKATRAAIGSALKAHVEVSKGEPLRLAISRELDASPKLGGNERRFVAFTVRELSRHLRRLDTAAKAAGHSTAKLQLPEDRAVLRYALWRRHFAKVPVEKVLKEVGLPGPIRPRSIPDAVIAKALEADEPPPFGTTPVELAASKHSFPMWLAEAIAAAAPPDRIDAVLEGLNREPVLTLRARPPGKRDALLAEVNASGFAVEACSELPDALRVTDGKRAIFDSRFMKNGQLQVMDLGSQLLAAYCQVSPGQVVVDYCAGAGGKTLVLADAVGDRGRVYAWDAKPKRLAEAKQRTSALRMNHVSFPTLPRIDLADVVLVDAPCSGTGTLAREPDHKWTLTADEVAKFAKTQSEILDAVAAQLRSGAVIVYGTCSLLRAEDEAVVDAFLSRHGDFTADGPALRVWPDEISGGGFFGARLKKR